MQYWEYTVWDMSVWVHGSRMYVILGVYDLGYNVLGTGNKDVYNARHVLFGS